MVDPLFFTFALLCWLEWIRFTFPLNLQLIGHLSGDALHCFLADGLSRYPFGSLKPSFLLLEENLLDARCGDVMWSRSFDWAVLSFLTYAAVCHQSVVLLHLNDIELTLNEIVADLYVNVGHHTVMVDHWIDSFASLDGCSCTFQVYIWKFENCHFLKLRCCDNGGQGF